MSTILCRLPELTTWRQDVTRKQKLHDHEAALPGLVKPKNHKMHISIFIPKYVLSSWQKKLSTKQLEIHTSYNSSCKWTKSLDIDIFYLKIKRRLEFSILKFTDSLLSCCCPVQKYPPRMAELAWQLSSYLWRGSMNFKIKSSRPLFTKMAMSRLTVAPLSTRMPSLYLFRS